MKQLETVVVYDHNPITNRAQGCGIKRQAIVEYQNDSIIAIYTASPNLKNSKDVSGEPGVVVIRKPIICAFTDDAGEKAVTVSLLSTDTSREVVSRENFDVQYNGLPVTM